MSSAQLLATNPQLHHVYELIELRRQDALADFDAAMATFPAAFDENEKAKIVLECVVASVQIQLLEALMTEADMDFRPVIEPEEVFF